MSTDAHPLGSNEPGAPSRFMHRFDLHSIWGLVVLMLAATILAATGATEGFDLVFWVGMAAQAPYFIFMFVAARRHRVFICPHCIDEFPLNPGEAAAGRARFPLRYFHFVADGTEAVVQFLLRFVRSRILALLLLCALSWLVAWPIRLVLDVWSTMVFFTAAIYFVYAFEKHQKLQIWCPQCRHDGRGDDDDDPPEPEPEPDPAVSTELEKVA